MEYIIENEQLKAVVSSKGCELISVEGKENKREYIWDANPDAWKRHAPVLFPLVGKYRDGKAAYNGSEYPLSQHGFARDMEFELVSADGTEVVMKLSDTEETLKKYPFHFELICSYKLEKNAVTARWQVNNTNTETMYFSIGGHPAFAAPQGKDTCENCKIQVKTDKTWLDYKLLNADGLVEENVYRQPLDENGCITITKDMFDKDAWIVENKNIHQVSLLEDGMPFVTVDFNSPVFGLWSPVGKGVPFVCIEPWYGRADAKDFSGTLKDREYGNALAAGAGFIAEYTMIFF
jgi:galactose mutarotase-like enzyme